MPTQTDLNSWVTITPLAAANTITTNVGLFGKDLTDFYADCAVASTVCTASAFKDYTGWAIGVEWTWATTPADTALTGVCFADDKTCINIKTATGAANTI